jgi:hypothetical protein
MKCSGMYTQRDSRNLRSFNLWFLTAMSVFVAATFALSEKHLAVRGPLAVAIVAVTTVLLAGSVVPFLRFLREADELLRKIQIDALGAAFAASVVFMLGYGLCEQIGAPKLDVDAGVVVLVAFWALGQYFGFRRYAAEVQA